MKKGFVEMQVLKEMQPEIKVTITKSVDPKDFLKSREGLYVYENDRMENLIKITPQIAEGNEYALESLELVADSTDEQIEKSLDRRGFFSEGNAVAIIAELITKQPKGEEGLLLNNGYANLFYTPASVVDVVWSAGHGGWGVGAWGRGGVGWRAGGRVFSPQLTLDN